MFIPIFLFFMLRHFLPLRLCVILIITFMFTPVLERFGFAQFHYVREMWKGFPEPLGYGLFLGALAMTAQLISLTSRVALSRGMLAAWIGVATAGAVALRPNLALAALFLLGMLSLSFIVEQRWKELVFLGTGFAPILLIGFHNWYFGGSFVPLTSSALDPSNLVVPPSTYLEAGRELLHLNFDGSYLSHIVKHLGTWNSLTDVYRLPVLFVAFWVVLRPGYEPALKGLAAHHDCSAFRFSLLRSGWQKGSSRLAVSLHHIRGGSTTSLGAAATRTVESPKCRKSRSNDLMARSGLTHGHSRWLLTQGGH